MTAVLIPKMLLTERLRLWYKISGLGAKLQKKEGGIMRKGFTLIELIIVVIIVGILASFAIPQYTKLTTKAKAGKAKHAISLIKQAEKLYAAEHDAYINVSEGSINSDVGKDVTGVDLSEVDGDTDFDYSTSGCDADDCTVTAAASHQIGGCAEDSTISYTFSTGAFTLDSCYE